MLCFWSSSLLKHLAKQHKVAHVLGCLSRVQFLAASSAQAQPKMLQPSRSEPANKRLILSLSLTLCVFLSFSNKERNISIKGPPHWIKIDLFYIHRCKMSEIVEKEKIPPASRFLFFFFVICSLRKDEDPMIALAVRHCWQDASTTSEGTIQGNRALGTQTCSDMRGVTTSPGRREMPPCTKHGSQSVKIRSMQFKNRLQKAVTTKRVPHSIQLLLNPRQHV